MDKTPIRIALELSEARITIFVPWGDPYVHKVEFPDISWKKQTGVRIDEYHVIIDQAFGSPLVIMPRNVVGVRTEIQVGLRNAVRGFPERLWYSFKDSQSEKIEYIYQNPLFGPDYCYVDLKCDPQRMILPRLTSDSGPTISATNVIDSRHLTDDWKWINSEHEYWARESVSVSA